MAVDLNQITIALKNWAAGGDGKVRGYDPEGLLGTPPQAVVNGWTNVTQPLDATGTGIRVDIGGGNNDHADFTTFDPDTLTPGSVVNLFHRATPYNEKMILHKSGTEAHPIIFNGVTDANGNRPEVSGINATSINPEDGSTTWTAPYGMWNLTYSRDGGIYNDPTEWYEFRNLKMYGAHPNYTSDGGITYSELSSPLYFNEADNIKIIGCIFTDNANGIYIHSGNRTNKNYYIGGCYFEDNGVVGSNLRHAIYHQCVGDTPFCNIVEGCFFAPMKAGSLGIASVKNRGTDFVFRYNTITVEERALDIVEAQDSAPDWIWDNLTSQQILDRYRTALVYGNQFFFDDTAGYDAVYGIHVGMDTGTGRAGDLDQRFNTGGSAQDQPMARGYQSPAYIYHNSFYINSSTRFNRSLLDLDAGSAGTSQFFGSVEMTNNVYHLEDTTLPLQTVLAHTRYSGNVVYSGVNHIYMPGNSLATINESTDGVTDPDVTITGGVAPTLVAQQSGLDPLFTNVANTDLTTVDLALGSGSAAIGQAGSLPAFVASYQPTGQPILASLGGGVQSRATNNDLGAYESV